MSIETDVPLITGCYSTTTTTGDYQFGAALEGCQHPDAACTNGLKYQYHVRPKTGGAGVYEAGIGTVNTSGSGTMVRFKILKSSNANAAVDWTGVEIVISIVLSGQTLAKAITAFPNKPLGEAYLIYNFGQSENGGSTANNPATPYALMDGISQWTRLGATTETVANYAWAVADPTVTPRSNPGTYQIGLYGSGYGSVILGLAQSLRLATGADVLFLAHSNSGGSITTLERRLGAWSISIEEHIAALQSHGSKPANCPAYPDIVTYSQGWTDVAIPHNWAALFRRFYDEANDSTLRGWSHPINTHWLLMDMPFEMRAGAIETWNAYADAITYIDKPNVHYMSTDDALRWDFGVHVDGTQAYWLGQKAFRVLWGMEIDVPRETAWRIQRYRTTLKNTLGVQEATGDGNPAAYNFKIQSNGKFRVHSGVGVLTTGDWFSVKVGAHWRIMETADTTKWRVYRITASPRFVGTNQLEFESVTHETAGAGAPTIGVALTSELVLINIQTGIWEPRYVYTERATAMTDGAYFFGGGEPALFTGKALSLAYYADGASNLSGTGVLASAAADRAMKIQALRSIQINENLNANSLANGLHVVGMTGDLGNFATTAWRENQYMIRTSGAAVTTTIETFTFADPTNIIYEIDVQAYRVTASGNRDMFRKVFRGGWSRMGATTDYTTVTESTDQALAAAAAGTNFTVTANAGAHTLALACVGPTSSAIWSWNVTFRWRNVLNTTLTTP